MSFNELLEECGEFGPYQKFIAFGFLAPTLFLVSVTYWTQVFILLIPPHRCKMGPDDNIWTSLNIFNITNITTNQENKCYIDSSFLNKSPNRTGLYPTPLNETSTKVLCPYGWIYDYSSYYPTFASENDWVCEDAWKMYVVHTCFWSGAILGSIVFGFYSDRFGRKRAYQLAILTTLTSDILTLFAKNQMSFYAARFFSAFGEGNVATLAFVLVMEYTGPSKRKVNLFIWSGTYTIVSSIMPWVAYGVHNWKYVLAISWIPSLSTLIISCFIPESASWLLTRGRLEEASRLVHRMAKVNGKDISYDHIKSKLEKHQASMEVKPQQDKIKLPISIKNKSGEGMTFFQATVGLLKTPNMRKKTISLIIIWMIACMCYNGNSLELSHLPFQFYVAYSIGGLMELPGNIFCIFTLDKLGRRWTTAGCFMIGGILGILSGYIKNSMAVLVMAMIMRCCYATSYDVAFTFSSESFPTVVRGRGISIIRTFGSVGSALAPFIVALAEKDPLFPMIVFGVLAVFGGILTLLLPETAKQHLSHTLEDGENFGRDQSFWLCPFKQIDEPDLDAKNRKKLKRGDFKDNFGFEANYDDGVKIIGMKSCNLYI